MTDGVSADEVNEAIATLVRASEVRRKKLNCIIPSEIVNHVASDKDYE